MISAHPFRLCAVLQDVSCETDRLRVAYLVPDHVPGVFGGYGIYARLPEGELWVVPGQLVLLFLRPARPKEGNRRETNKAARLEPAPTPSMERRTRRC